MAKLDLVKALGPVYAPTSEPALVEVPELSFLMVDGRGDPVSSPAYAEAIQALFSVSFTLRFALKRGPEALDYRVMPLEGLWWAPAGTADFAASRTAWEWTAMMAQPDAVTAAHVAAAVEAARARRPLPATEHLRLERLAEGLCVQVMHLGPYSAEGPTIARLHAFAAAQGCTLRGRHHEVYLGDPRRSAPERLRTIVRQPVARGPSRTPRQSE